MFDIYIILLQHFFFRYLLNYGGKRQIILLEVELDKRKGLYYIIYINIPIYIIIIVEIIYNLLLYIIFTIIYLLLLKIF